MPWWGSLEAKYFFHQISSHFPCLFNRKNDDLGRALRLEAREQYDVVPAQALMELFLAEEGAMCHGTGGLAAFSPQNIALKNSKLDFNCSNIVSKVILRLFIYIYI